MSHTKILNDKSLSLRYCEPNKLLEALRVEPEDETQKGRTIYIYASDRFKLFFFSHEALDLKIQETFGLRFYNRETLHTNFPTRLLHLYIGRVSEFPEVVRTTQVKSPPFPMGKFYLNATPTEDVFIWSRSPLILFKSEEEDGVEYTRSYHMHYKLSSVLDLESTVEIEVKKQKPTLHVVE